jgi:1,4-alpha-glucan branching enzyme
LDRVYSGKKLRALIRHKTASDKVWSEDMGYPTHANYLDFHKKEYDSSLRYWKVTNHESGSDAKLPYSPDDASRQAALDAGNYISYLEELALQYREAMHENGAICLAFDTELFGHWWFEGPQFLEHFICGIQNSEILEMTFPSEIPWNECSQIARSSAGSWGVNGTDETWKNEQTSWLLEEMHASERIFESALHTCDRNDALQVRILNQALRELLLLQASDWPFLITKNQAVDYAESRFKEHHEYFLRLITLFEVVLSGEEPSTENLSMLANIEHADDVLQEITIHRWSNH